jgi:hypothetical protein
MTIKVLLDPTAASTELVKQRLNICRTCPHMEVYKVPVLNREIERCSKCTCPLLTRTYFARSVCGDKQNPKW